jgi:hypothetical protein
VNGDVLQERIDRARATTPQRWWLGAVAFVAAVAASVVANVAGRASVVLLVFVSMLALVAVVDPDSHIGSWVVAFVVVQWLLVVDDVTTPAAIAAATCLLLFHTLVALMAVTPASSTVPSRVLGRWGARAVVVGGATFAVWALVSTFDRWQLPDATALLVTGFVLVVVGAAALIVRSYR